MARLLGALLLAVPSSTSGLSLGGLPQGDAGPEVVETFIDRHLQGDLEAKERETASRAGSQTGAGGGGEPIDSNHDLEEVETATVAGSLIGKVGSKVATSMLTEVDMWCDTVPRPLSDTDERLGSGNPVCRYEPDEDSLKHWADNPADIAIVIPSNYEKDSNVSEDPADHDPLFLGVLAWKLYARYHGYAFYSGPPERSCPELEERHAAWTKPCTALSLIKKHKYLIMVDRDTTVIKPRLRLEPLFAMAGLMTEGGHKVLAVAEEWGSCKKGVRSPLSGDVNTGIVLVRRSPQAQQALASWYYGPTWCKSVTTEPVDRPVWWPFHEEPCQGCSCITRGVHEWSYDQIGFYTSVANNDSFRSLVTVFRAGCPINSPFADFIPHLISGTPRKEAYDANHRDVISKSLHTCVSDLMFELPSALLYNGEGGNLYSRCSLCDALPEGYHPHSRSWTQSCRSPTPVPKSRRSTKTSWQRWQTNGAA